MPYYAVIRDHGPDWNASVELREQEGWAEHAAFMDVLFEEGFLMMAGPLGADAALLVVDAESEETIEARLAEDPWPATMLHTRRVDEWKILLGEPVRRRGG